MQGKEMIVNPWDATCLSQKQSGGLYCRNMHLQLLAYLTWGVTQASISSKNDFKINQSSAEFETQERHSIIKHRGEGEGRGGEGRGEGLAQRSNLRTQVVILKKY